MPAAMRMSDAKAPQRGLLEKIFAKASFNLDAGFFSGAGKAIETEKGQQGAVEAALGASAGTGIRGAGRHYLDLLTQDLRGRVSVAKDLAATATSAATTATTTAVIRFAAVIGDRADLSAFIRDKHVFAVLVGDIIAGSSLLDDRMTACLNGDFVHAIALELDRGAAIHDELEARRIRAAAVVVDDHLADDQVAAARVHIIVGDDADSGLAANGDIIATIVGRGVASSL